MSANNIVPSALPEEPAEAKWGEANEARGANFHSMALQFAKDFPIGSQLTVEKFDTWAHQKGHLNVPFAAPKKSDVWLAHLQRRHQLRYNINKASAHPRMTLSGGHPYSVDTTQQGMLEVRTPQAAVAANGLPKKLQTLFNTRRKQLGYLMQSADWSVLPVHERSIAEALYDDIAMFQEMVDLQANGLTTKFDRLEHKIRKAIEQGQIVPVNHGISGLLEDGSSHQDK